MDAEWVRYLGLALAGLVGYFAKRWIDAILLIQKEKEAAIWRELKRLSKNYHDHAEYLRELGFRTNTPVPLHLQKVNPEKMKIQGED